MMMADDDHTDTSSPTSLMFREAGEASATIAAQLIANSATTKALAARLRAQPPRAVITLGRGSSDNAATYARYLIETRLACLTASFSLSIGSLFRTSMDMRGIMAIAISQSGRSADLLAAADAAQKGGALLVAMVNDDTSPLARLADVTLPLHAGEEKSVAATKSYLASLTAIAQLVSHWGEEPGLLAGLETLPEALALAWGMDWSPAIPPLCGAHSLYVMGRGLTLAAAQEAALKFKESCALHAEAFSSAEICHGPATLARDRFPVLAFPPQDASRSSVLDTARRFRAQGAHVMMAGEDLPIADTHPALLPLVQIQSFYRMVEKLSLARGHHPDQPPHLAKVTSTL